MSEVLISDRVSFDIEVSFELMETGNKGRKPLIVYLHGFKQNMNRFQRYTRAMRKLEAFHLYIQGPYPIYDEKHRRKVSEWGRAWYLYDGEQEQFVQSLEKTSSFIERVVGEIQKELEYSRLAVFGYSMGAYLAGYLGLSRPSLVNELIMIGGRLKTELVDDGEGVYNHMNVLALHGSKDNSVKSKPQKDSVKHFEEWGANTSFRKVNEGHQLSAPYLSAARRWLEEYGYERLQ